jgi:5-formyltetrahydrofolate cyclo-ligase
MQEAIPDPGGSKRRLRAAMRRLAPCPPAESAAARARLGGWLAAQPGPLTIAIYQPLDGEADLTELAAHHAGHRWAWPRVAGDALHFHHVTDPPSQLAAGAFGVMEPRPDLPVVAVAAIDVFLCPGLAFDARGGRLGRGRGYYDRTLAAARPDALKIGVCDPSRLVPDTFAEPHDVMMDRVIAGGEELVCS